LAADDHHRSDYGARHVVALFAIGLAWVYAAAAALLALLALTLFCYVLLTQGVKMWLIRKAWI